MVAFCVIRGGGGRGALAHHLTVNRLYYSLKPQQSLRQSKPFANHNETNAQKADNHYNVRSELSSISKETEIPEVSVGY